MKLSSKRKRRNPTKTGSNPFSACGRVLALLAVLLLGASIGAPQTKPKKGEPQTRSLTGVVTLPDGKPAVRAVVELENGKTKSIVSFYSQQDGSYFFHELSPDVDYTISARLDDMVSSTRPLSSFDSRKDAVINLKLAKKK